MQTPTHTKQSTDQRVFHRSRGVCWRAECRRVNGPYHTVSYLEGNVIVARCHRGEYRTLFDLAVELKAHVG